MKKMLAVFAALALLQQLLLCAGALAETNEASYYSAAVTTREELSARLDEICDRYVGTYWTKNGSPTSDYTQSRYYYGWQCKGFGNYVFNELFKTGNIGPYNESAKYYLNSVNSATLISQKANVGASDAAAVKDFLSGAMKGDMIQVLRRSSSNAHTMIVYDVSDTGVTILDCNSDGRCKVQRYTQTWATFASKNISMSLYHSTVYPAASEVHGAYMENGYERVLPDGNYYILSAADPRYFLDIDGVNKPAGVGDNVHLYFTDTGYIGDCDVWTIKYLDAGFYTISQMNYDIALEVAGASDLQGYNVRAWSSNGSSAQLWAISYNGDRGFRLQARCSSFSLDINTGVLEIGQNVQQWSSNDTDAQRWIFIPYTPERTLPDGRYVLKSAKDSRFELDAPGNDAAVSDGTAMQIWEDSGCLSRYNSFDIASQGDGYYTLTHSASGLRLTASAGCLNGSGITLAAANGGVTQQWAITRDGLNGGYMLRARSNGMALDIYDNQMSNGTRVIQWPWKGSANQTWTFEPAEYAITYSAEEGANVPSAQTKYYRENATLSDLRPTRDGYAFIGWATVPGSRQALFQPGDTYAVDENLDLYAIWRSEAVLTLPASIRSIEDEAFAGTDCATVIVPEGCKRIGARAFADCKSLWRVVLPASLTYIAPDAFVGCTDVTLLVHENTAAYLYARAYGMRYELMED